MADKQNTEVIRQLLKDCNKWTPGDNIRYSPFTGTGTVIIKIPIECLLIDQSINEYNLSIEISSTSDVEMKFEQLRIYIGSFKKALDVYKNYNLKKNNLAPNLDVNDFIFNQIIKLPVDLMFTNIFKSKKVTVETYDKIKIKEKKYQYIYFTSDFKLRNLLLGNACIPTRFLQHKLKKDIIYEINEYRKEICNKNNCTLNKKLDTYTYKFCVTKKMLKLVKLLYPKYNYNVCILGNRGDLNSGLFICFCAYKEIDKIKFDCNVDDIIQDEKSEYPNCQIGEKYITYMVLFNRDVYICNLKSNEIYFRQLDFSEFIKSDIKKKEIELYFPATEKYLTWLTATTMVNINAEKETRRYASMIYEHAKGSLKEKENTRKREEIQKIVQRHEEQKKLRKKFLEKKKEMEEKEKVKKQQQQKKKEINRQKRLKRKEKLKLKKKEFAEENKKLIEEEKLEKEKLRIQKEKDNLLIEEEKKKNIVVDILKSVINKCCREAERKIKKLHKKKLKKFKIKLKNIIFLRYFNNWKNTIINIKSLEKSELIQEEEEQEEFIDQEEEEEEEEEEEQEEFIDQQEEMIDQQEEFINNSVTECKWGINCRRPDCYYNHSYGRIIDSWIPPHPEWQWGMPLPFNYPPPPPQLNPFYYCPPVIPANPIPISPNTITYNF